MINQKVSKSDELFFVVDENNNPLKPLPRKLVHGHNVWHRVSHVWIFDGKDKILCQQRSLTKELGPGLWDPFFGGHLSPGESYEFAAQRELFEEIHLNIPQLELKIEFVYKNMLEVGNNNEFQAVFVITWNGDVNSLSFDDGEVEQISWISLKELAKTHKTKDQRWIHHAYIPKLFKAQSWGGL